MHTSWFCNYLSLLFFKESANNFTTHGWDPIVSKQAFWQFKKTYCTFFSPLSRLLHFMNYIIVEVEHCYNKHDHLELVRQNSSSCATCGCSCESCMPVILVLPPIYCSSQRRAIPPQTAALGTLRYVPAVRSPPPPYRIWVRQKCALLAQ